MIKRINRVLDKAYFARTKEQDEIDVTADSYTNALAIEAQKESTFMIGVDAIIEDLVKIKQSYPSNHMSTITTSLDIVIMEGKDFRELKKLINGLHEVRTKKECPQDEEKEATESHQGIL